MAQEQRQPLGGFCVSRTDFTEQFFQFSPRTPCLRSQKTPRSPHPVHRGEAAELWQITPPPRLSCLSMFSIKVCAAQSAVKVPFRNPPRHPHPQSRSANPPRPPPRVSPHPARPRLSGLRALATAPAVPHLVCMREDGKITGHDLVALGLEPGPTFASALSFARSELSRGLGWEEVSREVTRKFIRPKPVLLGLGPEKPVAVAATPSSEEEERNIAASLARIRELTRSPVVKAAALMPDTCPSGSGWGEIPVGGVVVTENAVIPAAHSADVNCGMSATFFESARPLSSLMEVLRASTTFGPFPVPPGQENGSPVLSEPVWENPFLRGLESDALRYLGTQGDGNHFSYLGRLSVTKDLVGRLGRVGHEKLAARFRPYVGTTLWGLVTHHGSRNFGAKVYRRGLEAAVAYTSTVAAGIPKSAAWLDLGTRTGADYWEALRYVSRWTAENHAVIHRKFLSAAGSMPIANISNHHNAVWRREGGVYHGKGATPAWKTAGVPRLGIIPLNMGREILLVEGSDNARFLSFAPHGAGRNRSRSATKAGFVDAATGQVDMDRVNRSVAEQAPGVEVAWASGRADISETPMGYKPASKVKEEIESHGLATIIAEISPRGCMMAGDFGEARKSRPRPRDRGVSRPAPRGLATLPPPGPSRSAPPPAGPAISRSP